MKKLSGLAATIISLLSATAAYASDVPGHIEITRPQIPTPTGPKPVGFSSLGDFIQKTLTIAFAVAIIVVLAMLIWGAFEWITSGGEKDAVASARNRIINALIGLAVLAVAFALFKVAGQFLGFDVANFNIPTPAP